MALQIAIEQGRDHKCLLFHMTIDTCNWLQKQIANDGNEAWALHSDLSDDDRTDHLAAFKKARQGVLIAPRVLDEGVDIPDADVGINAANNTTKLQLVQRMGRVLRKYGNKEPVFYQLFCTIDVATKSVIDEVKNALAFEVTQFRRHVQDFGEIKTVDKIAIPSEWEERPTIKKEGPQIILRAHERKHTMPDSPQDNLSLPTSSMKRDLEAKLKKKLEFVSIKQLPEACGSCGKPLFLDTYIVDGKDRKWVGCHECKKFLREMDPKQCAQGNPYRR
jgi:superfamily II DNA or RNA helicase